MSKNISTKVSQYRTASLATTCAIRRRVMFDVLWMMFEFVQEVHTALRIFRFSCICANTGTKPQELLGHYLLMLLTSCIISFRMA